MPIVYADSLKHFEVLNGKLSIPFDKTINRYTVYLAEGESTIKANYILQNEKNTVQIDENDEVAIYSVFDNDQKIEDYYFYKKLSFDETLVFKENINSQEKEEIPNLHIYVIGVCSLIILILFKVIVIGFKKVK